MQLTVHLANTVNNIWHIRGLIIRKDVAIDWFYVCPKRREICLCKGEKLEESSSEDDNEWTSVPR